MTDGYLEYILLLSFIAALMVLAVAVLGDSLQLFDVLAQAVQSWAG